MTDVYPEAGLPIAHQGGGKGRDSSSGEPLACEEQVEANAHASLYQLLAATKEPSPFVACSPPVQLSPKLLRYTAAIAASPEGFTTGKASPRMARLKTGRRREEAEDSPPQTPATPPRSQEGSLSSTEGLSSNHSGPSSSPRRLSPRALEALRMARAQLGEPKQSSPPLKASSEAELLNQQTFRHQLMEACVAGEEGGSLSSARAEKAAGGKELVPQEGDFQSILQHAPPARKRSFSKPPLPRNRSRSFDRSSGYGSSWSSRGSSMEGSNSTMQRARSRSFEGAGHSTSTILEHEEEGEPTMGERWEGIPRGSHCSSSHGSGSASSPLWDRQGLVSRDSSLSSDYASSFAGSLVPQQPDADTQQLPPLGQWGSPSHRQAYNLIPALRRLRACEKGAQAADVLITETDSGGLNVDVEGKPFAHLSHEVLGDRLSGTAPIEGHTPTASPFEGIPADPSEGWWGNRSVMSNSLSGSEAEFLRGPRTPVVNPCKHKPYAHRSDSRRLFGGEGEASEGDEPSDERYPYGHVMPPVPHIRPQDYQGLPDQLISGLPPKPQASLPKFGLRLKISGGAQAEPNLPKAEAPLPKLGLRLKIGSGIGEKGVTATQGDTLSPRREDSPPKLGLRLKIPPEARKEQGGLPVEMPSGTPGGLASPKPYAPLPQLGLRLSIPRESRKERGNFVAKYDIKGRQGEKESRGGGEDEYSIASAPGSLEEAERLCSPVVEEASKQAETPLLHSQPPSALTIAPCSRRAGIDNIVRGDFVTPADSLCEGTWQRGERPGGSGDEEELESSPPPEPAAAGSSGERSEEGGEEERSGSGEGGGKETPAGDAPGGGGEDGDNGGPDNCGGSEGQEEAEVVRVMRVIERLQEELIESNETRMALLDELQTGTAELDDLQGEVAAAREREAGIDAAIEDTHGTLEQLSLQRLLIADRSREAGLESKQLAEAIRAVDEKLAERDAEMQALQKEVKEKETEAAAKKAAKAGPKRDAPTEGSNESEGKGDESPRSQDSIWGTDDSGSDKEETPRGSRKGSSAPPTRVSSAGGAMESLTSALKWSWSAKK